MGIWVRALAEPVAPGGASGTWRGTPAFPLCDSPLRISHSGQGFLFSPITNFRPPPTFGKISAAKLFPRHLHYRGQTDEIATHRRRCSLPRPRSHIRPRGIYYDPLYQSFAYESADAYAYDSMLSCFNYGCVTMMANTSALFDTVSTLNIASTSLTSSFSAPSIGLTKAATGTLTLGSASLGTNSGGTNYALITNGGLANVSLVGNSDSISSGGLSVAAPTSLSFTIANSAGSLPTLAVPEPSTFLLGAAGFVGLHLFRRSQRRRSAV